VKVTQRERLARQNALYSLASRSSPRRFVAFPQVSALPEVAAAQVRVRFTSPHPKDFPLPLLQLIAERPSLCKQLHLPAQSGSNAVLHRMRRGYTWEAYVDLVATARAAIPGVAISSDFIAGFCGETEEDHEATLALIKEVIARYKRPTHALLCGLLEPPPHFFK